MASSLKVTVWSVGLFLLSQMWAGCAQNAAERTAFDPKLAGSSDQIVLAIGGEREEGFDPTLGWGRYGSPLFQSTLLRRDENLEIVNDLATGYTVSQDGLTWTVTLRKDAVFSDGKPVTAADVAYTFNQAARSGGLVDLTALKEAVAIDTHTVELRLQKPQSTFVNRLITLGIVPQHAHGPDYARKPIGSGPYRLVQWDEGLPLKKERWPEYLSWAVDAFRLATGGAKPETQIHTHMCYSEFGDIIEHIERLDADVLSIENSRSNNKTLLQIAQAGYRHQVGNGVYDVHSPAVPSVEQILQQLRTGLAHLPVEQTWVNPDCGLKTRRWEEVIPALKNMVAAAHQLGEELLETQPEGLRE